MLLIILSCSCGREKVSIISYQLGKSDFIETINTPGTIRATNTLSIAVPRLRVSGITVVFLAAEGEYVNKGDTVCILDAPDLTRNYENVNSRLEQLKMDLNKMMIDNIIKLSSLESELDNMEITISLNSLDSVQSKFAPPVRQKLFALELEKANAEKLKLQKRYAAEKQIYEADLTSINTRIKTTESELKTVLDQINSLTITAPQDGIVLHAEGPLMMAMSSLGIINIGGKIAVNSTVWPGMAVVQIPDLTEMEVSVEVPEADYRRILPGQNVQVSIEALNRLKTTGKIKRKTLVGNTRNQESAVKVYEVVVSIDSLHSLLTPGMSAGCEIEINNVKDMVVVPTMAIFERDSLQIVYVADGNRFLAVPVKTGLSNSSSSIVSAGLNGNETIALVEPPFNKIVRKEAAPAHSETADSITISTTLN
ncbi:MAG: efflux RND transporter periplasmic adaptor subunit [Bacteroidales bacterium]